MTRNFLVCVIWLLAAGCAIANTLDPALVGYWSFDEGIGTVAHDESGHGYDGTLENGPEWTSGIGGAALAFDGIDDHVSIPDFFTTSPSELTVMAWITSTQYVSADTREIIHHFRNGEFELSIHPNGNLHAAVKLTDDNGYGIEAPILPNTLHHAAFIWKKGEFLRIFVDGVAASQIPVPDLSLYDADWLDASIGSYDRDTRFFFGTIDEVKVYSRALTADEIRQEYNRPYLCAYWKFNEGSGLIAYDSSGHSNDGDLVGPVWVGGLPKLGTTLSFDGSTDFIRVGDSPSFHYPDAITVMAWAKVAASTEDHQVICAKWMDDHYQFVGSFVLEFHPDGLSPMFTITRSGDLNRPSAVSSVQVPLGQWAHVAGTYDGFNVSIYVNGISVGSVSNVGSMNIGDQPILIGSHTAYYDRNWFNGTLDEISVSRRAYTPQEVMAAFRAGLLCGDANGDAAVNISDAVYLIAYIFAEGSIPSPLLAGDANCDNAVNISDAVYLIAYIFAGGSVPCAGC